MRIIYIIGGDEINGTEQKTEDLMRAAKKTLPNFIMPGRKPAEADSGDAPSKWQKAAEHSATVLKFLNKGAGAAFMPAPVVWGAMIAQPLLAAYLNTRSSSGSAEESQAFEAELKNFIALHGVTISMVEHVGLRFPPGHPQVGQTYKQHPLADMPGSGKDDVYIPVDAYDEILMSEREAELLRLLIELGATRIEVSKGGQRSSNRSSALSAGFKALPVVSVDASASTSRVVSNDHSDSRVFELQGKPWKAGNSLDRSRFGWLHYEPTWEAVVFAREVGGCLKAEVEVKHNMSSRFERDIMLGIAAKAQEGNVSYQTSAELAEGKSLFFQAIFSEPVVA